MSFKQRVRAEISKTYIGTTEFKNGYQPRTSLVRDENDDLHADTRNILNRCKNCFSQLLNVHGVNDVRQAEMHTSEPLVPEPRPFSGRNCY
jgi:hypothetical protein